MKTVITYGTFDYFHYGHYRLLQRAKALGDRLIVGVSSDEFCAKKGKSCLLPLNERINVIRNLKFVDEIIVENSMEQKIQDCKKYNCNVFVLGSDYKKIFKKMKEYKILKEMGVEVKFLERTSGVSTSQIKSTLSKQTKYDKSNKVTIHKLTSK